MTTDLDVAPFTSEAVVDAVVAPRERAESTSTAQASSLEADADDRALDAALLDNAQDIVDALVLAVAEIRLHVLADVLGLLLRHAKPRPPLFSDEQLLFVLQGFETAGREPLADALARLTRPPHHVVAVHDRLVDLKHRLLFRALTIAAAQQHVEIQSGRDKTLQPRPLTHIGPRARTAADWLPLDLIDPDPLADIPDAQKSGAPVAVRVAGEKLSPEELHGRLVNVRGFDSVPHAQSVERIAIQGRIEKRRRRVAALQDGTVGADLTPEERRREIAKERGAIKADQKRARAASALSRGEQARLDFEEAQKALDGDPNNAAKKRRLKSAADKLSLLDPDFRETGAPTGVGGKTYVVMQLEIPGEVPLVSEGTNTSTDKHAETHALAQLQQQLDNDFDLDNPADKARIAKAKLTIMPDQIVCDAKCRPDIADFAKRNGLTDVKAVYVVRQSGNSTVDVTLGEVTLDPAGNREKAIEAEFKKRGLTTPKTGARTAATGKTPPAQTPHFVVTEDLLSDELKLEYRRYETNLPTPPKSPGGGRGSSTPSVPDDVEPPKTRIRRALSALKKVGRFLIRITRAALTALEILEPFLVFAEGLSVALGDTEADLYRKKVAKINKDLRREIVRFRRAEEESRQVSGALLTLFLSGTAIPVRDTVEVMDELKEMEVATYESMLSLLSRRDLARRSVDQVEAQEEIGRKLLFSKDEKLFALLGTQGAGGLPQLLAGHQALLRLRPVLAEHVLLLDEMIRLKNLDYLVFRNWFVQISGEDTPAQIPDALIAPAVPNHRLGLAQGK